jgi:lactoylglutathione lyase
MAAINELAIRPNRTSDVAAAFEIAFVTADPEAAYQMALAAGASGVKPPALKSWDRRSPTCATCDLNGCVVELCSPVAG